ncbi:MAG TPA: TonB-dependent receptor [Chitinophagaceae bacterium]|nr:TonB-dependent receptor [Chitinophagaceae bacterium]
MRFVKLKPVLACLFFFVFNASLAQHSITISGKITDPAGIPVKYASVRLLNTYYATASDHEGKFKINNIPAGVYIAEISAIGFAEQQKELNATASLSVDVVLKLASVYLDEAVVTAQKKEERLHDIPFSLSVLSSVQVEQYRLWNSRELSGIAPNLYVSNPGDNRNVIAIRGISSTSYDPAVTTYIDGVAQFSLDTYIAELLDIERIEILRGPQGTLYGRNAMGGIINIITRQPGDKFTGTVEAGIGNYGLQRYSTVWQFPLAHNKLRAGIAAVFNTRNGYYTNEFDGSSFDRQRTFTGNYFLKYLPGAKWKIALNIKHQLARNNGAFPLVFGVQQAFEEPFKLEQNAVAEMTDNVANASLSIGYMGRTINVESQTAYQRNYRFYDKAIDADFSALDAVAIFNNYGRKYNISKAITQEFKLASPPSARGRLKWVGGSYLFVQENPVKQATRFGKDAMLAGAPDSLFSVINTTAAKNYGFSFYGQAMYSVSRKFELFVGLRYDWERKRLSILSEYQKDPDPDPAFMLVPDTAAAVSLQAVSPRAGLLFRLNQHVNFYCNYGRGYRAGGLTQLSPDPSQIPLYPYQPEYSNNFEIGVKASMFNHRLDANVAAFFIKADNVQVPTLVLPDAITITRNSGELISKGIEVELLSAPTKGLQLTYNIGYIDATYKALRLSYQGEEKNFSGNRQVFTPEITSMLAAQYDFSINPQVKFIIRAEWFYFGSQYFDLANNFYQGPYHLLNLNAGFAIKRYKLMFWARNATDTRYIDYAYDFGGAHLGNPRTYGITGRIRI